ncbi:MAG: GtrA family protein [Victivallales bacterium]
MKSIPDNQVLRYLIVGGWNTVFGYGFFALLYFMLSARIHYVIIAVISNIISITMAYAGYKLFVFKTKGDYLAEYLKFYVVYGFSMILGLALLPFFVEFLKVNVYLAQALAITACVFISFIGHRNFSFKRKQTK